METNVIKTQIVGESSLGKYVTGKKQVKEEDNPDNRVVMASESLKSQPSTSSTVEIEVFNSDNSPEKSSNTAVCQENDVICSEGDELNLPSSKTNAGKSGKSEGEASFSAEAGTSKMETISDKFIPVYMPRKWSVSSSCLDDDKNNEDSDDDDDDDDDDYVVEDNAFLRVGVEYFDEDEFDNDFDDFDLNLRYGRHAGEMQPVPLYEEGSASVNKCIICYEMTDVRSRLCCESNMCDPCFDSYLEYKVNEGVINIGCPDDVCKSFIHRDEILARLPEDLKVKYYRFLVDANKDPCVKTCPRCNHVRTVEKEQLQGKRKKKGLELTCSECELVWCFLCHAPWHANMTCSQFRKGEKLLHKWAEEMPSGQLNAQKCPKCKIFIQRLSGCDHMTCSSCKTSFCYRCGKRYHNLKLFGSHYSRYSPFGCKYNLLPNRPVPRRLIRGAVFGGKLLAGVTLGALAVAAGAVLVGASFIVVPAVVGYKVRKQRRIARENRRWKERHQLRMAELTASENHELLLREFHQNVRVVIHRLDVDETSLDEFDTGRAVLMTSDVQEMTTEDGYTQYVAHFVSRNAETELPPLSPTPGTPRIQENETSNPEPLEKYENIEYESKDMEGTQNDGSFQKSKSLEAKAKDTSKDILKSKSLDNKLSKDGGNWKSTEKDTDLLDIELSAADTNGCFVNILSKTINSWQGHETLPKTFGTSKGSLKFPAGTWEKGGKKRDTSKDRMDIHTFSNLMAIQADKEQNPSQDGRLASQENDCISITHL